MISRHSNRMKNEWALLTYSLKLLAGPGLIAIGMIIGVLLLMIFARPIDIFGSKLALLLFHLETFAPLLGIVIFSGLLGADLDAQCLDTLRTSEEGIARVILRKIAHSTLFAAGFCMMVLCVLRAFYTSFNVLWALGIVVPAIWYFGMLGLVATAATRKSLAGFTVGTAFLLMSISGQQLDPVRLDSYSGQRDLVNLRLLGEGNWLIAKVYFLVMTFILAFLVVRVVQGQRTRIRGTLAAVILVVTTTTGTHWLWARPVPLVPAADQEVLDVREKDGLRRVRIAISTLEEEKGKRKEKTLIREERHTRAGDQWVFQSSSFFHPNSETDLLHVNLVCAVEPNPAALTVSAQMRMNVIDGPTQHVFFYLATELHLTELMHGGSPIEFKRRHDLVDVILPAPVKPGDSVTLDLTYHGPLGGIAEGVSTDFIALFDHWYPATRDRMQNWVDPFTCRLEVRLPNPWQLAGATIIDRTAEQSVFSWVSTVPIHRPPLCVGIFRKYETQFRDVPVTVHAFTFDEAYAQRLLATCVDILGVHEEAFGPYPHARLAFVENRFQNASGVAHPGMMTLRADRTVNEQEDEMSDLLLPHEIAHQWWRLGLPRWLAEGGAVYANYRYLDLRRDRRSAVAFLTDKLYTPYMNSSSAIEPLVTDYANLLSMYTRGAYLFVHLESLVGRDGLSRALRDFLDRHLHASLVDEEAINRDCEQVLQTVAGEGLHSFVSDWMRSPERFDPSVVQVWQTESMGGYDIAMQLEHKGGLQFPTPIRLTYADGSNQDLTWPAGSVQTVIRHQGPQPVTVVELDPEHLLLDWNRANNQAKPTAAPTVTGDEPASSIVGWKSFSTQDGLTASRAFALHFGNDRNLYASFAHPGRIGGNDWMLNIFDGQWRALVPDPKQASTILAIARSREGTMWYGGYGSLWRVNEQQTTLWILKEERLGRVGAGTFIPRATATSTIPGSDVFALHCDRDDNLWVGTDHGASVLNATDGSWRHFSEAEGLGGQAVMALVEDDDGMMWAGTSKGAYSFRENRWTSHPDIAPNDLILSIAIDPAGTRWFGTLRSGIVAVADGTIRRFTSANSDLPHNLVSSMVCEPDGRLWFGGGTGLGCFDGDSWKHFDPGNSGLPSPRIHRLEMDESGHLWIGTDVGVTRYTL